MVPGSLVRTPYRMELDGRGAVSIHVERLLSLVDATLDALVGRLEAEPSAVLGVGLSCFLHSVCGLDERGQPVTALLTWADTTSERAAAELRTVLDESTIWARTGTPLHASSWAARIRHLRSSTGGRATRWAGLPELLHRRLTGEWCVDLSLASGTGLVDRTAGSWDGALLGVLGVAPDALPPIIRAGQAAGRLGAEPSARWPSLAETPWFPAWSDAWCGTIGCGAAVRDAALQVGTSSALRAILEDPVPPVPRGLFGHRLDERRSLLGGQLSEGGGIVAWLSQLVGRPPEELEARATHLAPDGHGLTLVPHLAGERGPGYRAEARGAIAGLTLSTGPAELYRAVLESVAYRVASIDRLLSAALGRRPAAIVASGGALAASPLWCRILADVLGRELHVTAVGEASLRGAALQVLEAAGAIPDATDLPAPPARIIEPDRTLFPRYREAAARQEALQQALLARGSA